MNTNRQMTHLAANCCGKELRLGCGVMGKCGGGSKGLGWQDRNWPQAMDMAEHNRLTRTHTHTHTLSLSHTHTHTHTHTRTHTHAHTHTHTHTRRSIEEKEKGQLSELRHKSLT